ncbi:MAG: type II secretion system F family protein, partial [Verrucomicrobiales bacterium]|nr:type II secretion system F family protein [Verrucomicrobiales bacterium]
VRFVVEDILAGEFRFEELAELLDAGLHLQQALGVLSERDGMPAVQTVSRELSDRLRDGDSFAVALRAASPSFDDLYTNLVAAGEASGTLGQILEQLAVSQTVMYDLQKRFVGALVYPAMMVGACVLLTVVFIVVLVPQLSDLLSKSGQELPMITKVLVGVGEFLAMWWWVILSVIAGAVGLFRLAIARPAGRRWWDERQLSLPLIGPVIQMRAYAGLAEALGNLVSNGVPLMPGLKLMVKATANRFFRGLLEAVLEDVGAGVPLSKALRKSGKFPKLLSDMVAVGEQTGRLGRSLHKAAKRYDRELDVKIKRLTAMISPVIIVFLAVVVTVVAYSIMTSIFSAVSGIRGAR